MISVAKFVHSEACRIFTWPDAMTFFDFLAIREIKKHIYESSASSMQAEKT
jgi:hypothetical protein